VLAKYEQIGVVSSITANQLDESLKKMGRGLCSAHLDFLHPARNLWRLRLGSVRLSEFERHMLGWDRGGSSVWVDPPNLFRLLARRPHSNDSFLYSATTKWTCVG
jgi:uncharacterized protein YprB with RNaseH-like and TPR domain